LISAKSELSFLQLLIPSRKFSAFDGSVVPTCTCPSANIIFQVQNFILAVPCAQIAHEGRGEMLVN